jgi:hypothetical protein
MLIDLFFVIVAGIVVANSSIRDKISFKRFFLRGMIGDTFAPEHIAAAKERARDLVG